MKELTPLNLAGGPYTNVTLQASVYLDNQNTALQVLDAETGEPIAVATVNVGVQLEGPEIHIKDYSENEGLFHWLVENDLIIPDPALDAFNGFITALGGVVIDDDLLEQIAEARIIYQSAFN